MASFVRVHCNRYKNCMCGCNNNMHKCGAFKYLLIWIRCCDPRKSAPRACLTGKDSRIFFHLLYPNPCSFRFGMEVVFTVTRGVASHESYYILKPSHTFVNFLIFYVLILWVFLFFILLINKGFNPITCGVGRWGLDPLPFFIPSPNPNPGWENWNFQPLRTWTCWCNEL